MSDERLAELADLLAGDIPELSDEQLIRAARVSGEVTELGPERTGRLLAELHGRNRLSWPRISELMGMPMTTVYTWVQPYLSPTAATRGRAAPEDRPRVRTCRRPARARASRPGRRP